MELLVNNEFEHGKVRCALLPEIEAEHAQSANNCAATEGRPCAKHNNAIYILYRGETTALCSMSMFSLHCFHNHVFCNYNHKRFVTINTIYIFQMKCDTKENPSMRIFVDGLIFRNK